MSIRLILWPEKKEAEKRRDNHSLRFSAVSLNLGIASFLDFSGGAPPQSSALMASSTAFASTGLASPCLTMMLVSTVSTLKMPA